MYEREPWCRGHFLEEVGETSTEKIQSAFDEADQKAADKAAAAAQGLETATA